MDVANATHNHNTPASLTSTPFLFCYLQSTIFHFLFSFFFTYSTSRWLSCSKQASTMTSSLRIQCKCPSCIEGKTGAEACSLVWNLCWNISTGSRPLIKARSLLSYPSWIIGKVLSSYLFPPLKCDSCQKYRKVVTSGKFVHFDRQIDLLNRSSRGWSHYRSREIIWIVFQHNFVVFFVLVEFHGFCCVKLLRRLVSTILCFGQFLFFSLCIDLLGNNRKKEKTCAVQLAMNSGICTVARSHILYWIFTLNLNPHCCSNSQQKGTGLRVVVQPGRVILVNVSSPLVPPVLQGSRGK